MPFAALDRVIQASRPVFLCGTGLYHDMCGSPFDDGVIDHCVVAYGSDASNDPSTPLGENGLGFFPTIGLLPQLVTGRCVEIDTRSAEGAMRI